MSHFGFMFRSKFLDPHFKYEGSRFGGIVWGHGVALDVMEWPYLGHRVLLKSTSLKKKKNLVSGFRVDTHCAFLKLD